MTALPSPEVVQAFILNTLSTNPDGTIPYSREISYNGRELRTAEEQAVVKGVLSSLVSKEVSLRTVGVWGGVMGVWQGDLKSPGDLRRVCRQSDNALKRPGSGSCWPGLFNDSRIG